MNKKQTIRKLGSIEAKPTKQTTQPIQPTPKKPKSKVLEIESDDDIEVAYPEEVEEPEVETNPVIKPKKKRVISEEQKKFLVDRWHMQDH